MKIDHMTCPINQDPSFKVRDILVSCISVPNVTKWLYFAYVITFHLSVMHMNDPTLKVWECFWYGVRWRDWFCCIALEILVVKSCPQCKKDTKHIGSSNFLQPPQYLIIIVNRFDNNGMTKNKTSIPIIMVSWPKIKLQYQWTNALFLVNLYSSYMLLLTTMASCWVLVTIQPQLSVAMKYIIAMITGSLFMIYAASVTPQQFTS